jgi:predicted esterase YcpF (UPF0227 family)
VEPFGRKSEVEREEPRINANGPIDAHQDVEPLNQPEAGAVFPIPAVYLLHRKAGSPEGTVKRLQTVLEQHWPGLDFICPTLPHHDPNIPAEVSLKHLLQLQIPQDSLLFGISLGGLVAARLQEVGRQDLKVVAISSPTWADGVTLETKPERRLAFYSSKDNVIESRIANWPRLASFSRDLEWLSHNTDQHLKYIARLFDWYLEGMLCKWIGGIRRSSSTMEERDEIVWSSMEAGHGRKMSSEYEWWGGRPRNFAEIGKAMRAGKAWE